MHRAVLDDFENLSQFDVYACGSSEMINVAKADFLDRGLGESSFHADAFTPFQSLDAIEGTR